MSVQDYPDYSYSSMVKTLLADNIIIDRLKVGAYTENRRVLSNDNNLAEGSTPPNSAGPQDYIGKFFPRGCRGILDKIRIYCYRTGTGTVKLAYAPYPGAGKVGSITVTPSLGWLWAYNIVHKMWNYDSLFIWIESISSDVSFGFDGASPYDWLKSDDNGVTWYGENYRPFIRAEMLGQTAGDIPVSGTINTIEIPHSSSEQAATTAPVTPGSEVTFKTVAGSGLCDFIMFRSTAAAYSHWDVYKVYCDGVLAMTVQPYNLVNEWGMADNMHTAKLSLVDYNVDGACSVFIHKVFEFKRELKLTVTAQASAGSHNAEVKAYPNLIA